MFPLQNIPLENWHKSPLAFGSLRDNGKRKHAGVDLYTTKGDQVLSIGCGLVIGTPYVFYKGLWAVEVRYGFGTVRYCELSAPSRSIRDYLLSPMSVREGEVLGEVGSIKGIHPMLHLELYTNDAEGPLTDRTNSPFMRRADLKDPTEWLDHLARIKSDWQS